MDFDPRKKDARKPGTDFSLEVQSGGDSRTQCDRSYEHCKQIVADDWLNTKGKKIPWYSQRQAVGAGLVCPRDPAPHLEVCPSMITVRCRGGQRKNFLTKVNEWSGGLVQDLLTIAQDRLCHHIFMLHPTQLPRTTSTSRGSNEDVHLPCVTYRFRQTEKHILHQNECFLSNQ